MASGSVAAATVTPSRWTIHCAPARRPRPSRSCGPSTICWPTLVGAATSPRTARRPRSRCAVCTLPRRWRVSWYSRNGTTTAACSPPTCIAGPWPQPGSACGTSQALPGWGQGPAIQVGGEQAAVVVPFLEYQETRQRLGSVHTAHLLRGRRAVLGEVAAPTRVGQQIVEGPHEREGRGLLAGAQWIVQREGVTVAAATEPEAIGAVPLEHR